MAQATPQLAPAPTPPMPEVHAVVEPPQQPQPQSTPQIQHYQPPVQPLPSDTTPNVAPVISQPMAQRPVVAIPEEPNPSGSIVTVQDVSDDAVDDEWIAKARTIAEQYRNDPYMQSNALSKLKAEYMQARHGKVIKVNNDII